MPEGEREAFPMTSDGSLPAPVRDRDVELCRTTRRSSSFRTAFADTEASASFHGADRFPVMFHTGPLMRSPAAAQFSPMSGPLYGGRNRGTPTPHPRPLLLPAAGEGRWGKTRAVASEKACAGGWVDEGGGYGGGRKGHLLDSGQLGMCSNPYCTTCPGAYHAKGASPKRPHGSSNYLDDRVTSFALCLFSLLFDFHNILYEDARGWARKYFSLINASIPIMNPHTKVVQQWNKFFVISCLVAIFIDPLFFFVLSVNEDNKCIVFNSPFAIAIAVVRSVTDFIYLLHMLLQFRLAYVSPESRVVGTGDFVIEPKKIALHYLRGQSMLRNMSEHEYLKSAEVP
ncbi:hypothetical protein Taro_026571 [Colocasia esculenta]|uniref:Uncharacterized protein n=1 Tax=Colocasia esculenta TaxID=4460 RepID=A0A843VJX7_COLES|nr:hypothetical protein [Colocasia esculenta]